MSIEGISLEHFSAAPQEDINSTTPSRQRHAVFHSFLSDDRKQDSATTTAHSKLLVSLIKNKKLLTTSLSNVGTKLGGRPRTLRGLDPSFFPDPRTRITVT